MLLALVITIYLLSRVQTAADSFCMIIQHLVICATKPLDDVVSADEFPDEELSSDLSIESEILGYTSNILRSI